MLLTKDNLSQENIEKAFNDKNGFSYRDQPEVRKAVRQKCNDILTPLWAERCGVSVEEFNNNQEHYSKLLASGYIHNYNKAD